MALKCRIIPILLYANGMLVKGSNFDNERRVGTLLPAVKVYNRRRVDELILLDITATETGKIFDLSILQEVAYECFVPLTVGGGIRSLEDIKKLLMAGADRVVINTAAYENPLLIYEAARFFGSQCVVVGVDVKRCENGSYECYSHNGLRPTGKLLEEWVPSVARLGAGEIMLTSIDCDGSMRGYDLTAVKKAVEVSSIPIIASGGAGDASHVLSVFQQAGASAAAMASILLFTHITPAEIKQECLSANIPVRMIYK